MTFDVQTLARMIDLSAVRADVQLEEVRRLADICRRYPCICAFVMPCYMTELVKLLEDAPDVDIGGVIGFPSAAESTTMKLAQTREHLDSGATEIDMVINVGRLKSGEDGYVEDEIRAVVEAAGAIPVKTILECHHLTQEEIFRASCLAADAGVAFVKTGIGWAPTGATLENVRWMKEAVEGRRWRPRPGYRPGVVSVGRHPIRIGSQAACIADGR